MAILDAVPGLEFQILVDGQPLPEYENEEEPQDDDTVTKYIEAQSGKKFAIKYKFNNSFHRKHHVRVNVYVDGGLDYVCRNMWGKDNCKVEWINLGPISKVGTRYFQQKFLFRELVVSKCKCPRMAFKRSSES
jgi:hypothetical protein